MPSDEDLIKVPVVTPNSKPNNENNNESSKDTNTNPSNDGMLDYNDSVED